MPRGMRLAAQRTPRPSGHASAPQLRCSRSSVAQAAQRASRPGTRVRAPPQRGARLLVGLRTLPPVFFRRASSWSMMPALVVSTITPNCGRGASAARRRVGRRKPKTPSAERGAAAASGAHQTRRQHAAHPRLNLVVAHIVARAAQPRRRRQDTLRSAAQGLPAGSRVARSYLMQPHLLMRPFSSTTILPARWSSMSSNSPM